MLYRLSLVTLCSLMVFLSYASQTGAVGQNVELSLVINGGHRNVLMLPDHMRTEIALEWQAPATIVEVESATDTVQYPLASQRAEQIRVDETTFAETASSVAALQISLY